MAYLASGFAFATEPNWERIRQLLPSFHLCGYKHRSRNLWLLDAWEQLQPDKEHHPFNANPVQAADLVFHEPPFIPTLVNTYDAIYSLLERQGFEAYGKGWPLVPLAIASAAGVSTFAFSADDETYDAAAFVESNQLIRLGMHSMYYGIKLDQGALSVFPYITDDDEEHEVAEARKTIASLVAQAIPYIASAKLSATVEVTNGFLLYQHPTSLWPTDWGDCAEILGFGTWDPLQHVRKDFALIFEVSSSCSPRIKPKAHAALWLDEITKELEVQTIPNIGYLGAIFCVVFGLFGFFLTCFYLLKSQRRKALQSGILSTVGTGMLYILDFYETTLKQSDPPGPLITMYAVYLCLSIGIAIWIRSLLVRK